MDGVSSFLSPPDPLSLSLFQGKAPSPNQTSPKLLAFSTLNLNLNSASVGTGSSSTPSSLSDLVTNLEDVNNNFGITFLAELEEDQVGVGINSAVGTTGSKLHILTGSPGNMLQEMDSNIYFSIQDLDHLDEKGYFMEELIQASNNEITQQEQDGEGSFVSLPFQSEEVRNLLQEIEVEEEEEHSNNSNSNFPEENDQDQDQDQEPEPFFEEHEPEVKVEGHSPLSLALSPSTTIEDGEKQELKCKFCGFICCSKSSLGIHERRHTGERPYACKYCGRLFNSAQCCKHHERLHTGDKPFECQYCGKKYAVSTRLKRHERVHTREEPYKCGEPGCGKTFRWFDAFRDHRNTHNGVPLYLCSVCGKSFTSYLKFYYHERGHFLKKERDQQRKLQQQQNAANGTPKPKPKKEKVGKKKGKEKE